MCRHVGFGRRVFFCVACLPLAWMYGLSEALAYGGAQADDGAVVEPAAANRSAPVFDEDECAPAAQAGFVANRSDALSLPPADEADEEDAQHSAEPTRPASTRTGMPNSPPAEVGAEPEEARRVLESQLAAGPPVVLSNLEQAGPAVFEEPVPGGPDSMISAITLSNEGAERIHVARNTSVVIDLKAHVTRAEITNPEVATIRVASPKRIIVTGNSFGSTQLILWVGEQQWVFNISVERDLSGLKDIIKSMSPTSDVRLSSIMGTIVLSGNVPDADTAERIGEVAKLYQAGAVQNYLNVAGVQQTMLRVVVAEVNRDAIRDLGVNWATGASDLSRDFFFANNLGQLNPTVFGSSGVGNVLLPNLLGGQLTYSVLPTVNGANTNVTFGFPRAEFQMFMNALRENRLSRILAEPNLVAISGQTATFLAGGEVPIPVAQGGAVAGAISIEYKEFGVRLGFTPTVVASQMLRLHVMTEISEAVPGTQLAGGLPIFTFTTRRVESTIECGNGQTFVIAGLLNQEVRSVVSKIPGLGDIPVLGALFSSTDYQKSNTELVVLVTPQLVEPLDPHQVPPPPGSLMTDPNDFELFALQKLEGTPRTAPEPEGVPREGVPVNLLPGTPQSWPSTQLALRGPWGLAEHGETN